MVPRASNQGFSCWVFIMRQIAGLLPNLAAVGIKLHFLFLSDPLYISEFLDQLQKMVRTGGSRKKGGEPSKRFGTVPSHRYDLWLDWLVDPGFLNWVWVKFLENTDIFSVSLWSTLQQENSRNFVNSGRVIQEGAGLFKICYKMFYHKGTT